ncbi:MAG: 4-amino-4-deoxychorismate lyase [Gammaproteobacteria bacterium]|jgi:4-amino-4-deoxychorismate lyase
MPSKLMPEQSINEVLHWQERGLHYGDGLFETLLKIDGEIPHWQAHYQRLAKGCNRLHLPTPDQSWLEQKTAEVTHDSETNVIKIIVTRGVGGRGLNLPNPDQSSIFVLAYPYTHANPAPLNISVCNTRLPINPNLAGLKHLNRLDYVLATIELESRPNKDEAILCDTDGFVVEGIISNLFFCKEGSLFTPDLELAGVEGIMRAKIIEYFASRSNPVQIGRFEITQLQQADECFLCNSVQGIRPIGSIDDQPFKVGPVTKSIMNQLNHASV